MMKTTIEYKQLVELLKEYTFNEEIDILDMISDQEQGIMVVDKDYKIIYYSNAMEEIESLNASDVLGKSIFDVFPDITRQKSTVYLSLTEGKSITERNMEYSTYKGNSVKTVASTFPLLKEGKVIASLDVSRNIHTMGKMMFSQEDDQKSSNDVYISKILTRSPTMKKAIDYCKRAAYQDAPVVLLGETGTGKELFAQSIHYSGNRKDKPFVALNCAAIPSELTEGILFGTKEGGFTGATDRAGLFEQADGGTLLLDEINSMSLECQAKLLRLLEEKTFRRVGGTTDLTCDVRIVATTNQDLMEAIDKGIFRRDLFYRISVITIEIPPLRDREGDIEYLTTHFIETFSKKLGRDPCNIAEDVMACFKAYHWPGNVRELRNVVEGILCLIPEKDDIKFEDLPRYMNTNSVQENILDTGLQAKKVSETLRQQLDRYEKQIIVHALSQHRSISDAAESLGLSRQSLQYRMQKLGIKKNDIIR